MNNNNAMNIIDMTKVEKAYEIGTTGGNKIDGVTVQNLNLNNAEWKALYEMHLNMKNELAKKAETLANNKKGNAALYEKFYGQYLRLVNEVKEIEDKIKSLNV